MARALIVEDNLEDADALLRALSKGGHRCVVLTDGLEIVSCAREFRPDVFFLDIVLPGEDGYALCRRIRKHPDLTQIPVVYVSATSTTLTDPAWGRLSGGAAYVTKPISAQGVATAMEIALAQRPRS